MGAFTLSCMRLLSTRPCRESHGHHPGKHGHFRTGYWKGHGAGSTVKSDSTSYLKGCYLHADCCIRGDPHPCPRSRLPLTCWESRHFEHVMHEKLKYIR